MRWRVRWRLGLAAGLLTAAAHAQTTPTPRPDTIKTQSPTFVADTARQVVVAHSPEPTDALTRRTGLRIGAAIIVLTLTTLLLYNVRSR